MQTHLLLEYGKIGNESQDVTVPHGALGYIGHNECVHAYRIRWCWERIEEDGRIQEGTGGGWAEEGETNVTENVQGSLIWKKDDALA